MNKTHKDVINILRHHVDIAVHLAPEVARPSLVGQVGQPTLSKCDRVGQLAREAGYQLDLHGQCVRCGLHVPMGRNMAYIDAILHLKCMGSVGGHTSLHLGFSLVLIRRAITCLGAFVSMEHM